MHSRKKSGSTLAGSGSLRASLLKRLTSQDTASTQSPAPHLLRCNDPPTDEERDFVAQFIAETEDAISLFNVELRQNPGNSALKKRQDNFEKLLQAHRIILSPVRFLPPEILQHIFLDSLSSRLDINPRWCDLPWAITQVCRQWRQAAVDFPALWNRLPTIDMKKISHSKKSFSAFFEEILARSHGMPFSFQFLAPSKIYTQHATIDLLVKHAERWGNITFQTTPQTIVAFQAAKGRLSSLRSLTLDLEPEDPISIDIFAVAPHLSDVSIINYPVDHVLVPWTQLTTIKENTCQSTTIQPPADSSSLFRVRRLETTRYSPGPLLFIRTTLPDLVILHLRFGLEYPQEADFFQNLTLPAIEEIVIFRTPGNVILPLISLMERGSAHSKLKTLSLRSAHFSDGELTRLLQLTPHLTKLEVNVPPIEDLRNLIPTGDSPVLIPKLSRLYLQDIVFIDGIKEVVWELARTRCELGYQLLDDSEDDQQLVTVRPGEWRQLAIFQLKFGRIFGSVEACYEAQTNLNGWDSVLYKNRFSVMLTTWAEGLCKEIPSIPSHHNVKERKFDFTTLHARRVDEIFRLIEEFNPRDVHDLYPSRLYIHLEWISTAPPEKIPGEAKYNFRARAAAIVKEWQPLVLADQGNTRWVTISPEWPYQLQYAGPGQLPPGISLDDATNSAIYGAQYESVLDGTVFDVTPKSMWEIEFEDTLNW